MNRSERRPREARGMTRRAALVRLASCAPLLAISSSCGPGGPAGPSREQIRARAATYDPELDCTDAPGLFPAELKTREDNQYTDASPHDDRYCFTCANFVKPETKGACAGCTTVKGPIHPLGWCKAWAQGRWQR